MNQSAAVFQNAVLRDGADALAERFRQFVRDQAFPCVGAKSAVARRQMRFVIARDMRSAWDDLRLYQALLEFAQAYRADRRLFQSFVVIFRQPERISERAFEESLW